jgi:hypothetical protein
MVASADDDEHEMNFQINICEVEWHLVRTLWRELRDTQRARNIRKSFILRFMSASVSVRMGLKFGATM